MSAQTRTTEHELRITRVFDAPRELVWTAWTDPTHLQRWWGPKNFTAPVIRTDLRVGGRYHWCMRGPDGRDYWSTGVFREIVPHERLVFTDSFADADGNPVSAAHYGMGDELPMEMLITVTLAESGGRTTMTLRHAGMPAGPHGEMASQGWNESFDKLAATVMPAS